MSNQGFYNESPGDQGAQYGSNPFDNPWQSHESHQPQEQQHQPQYQQAQQEQQQWQQQSQQQQQQQQHNFSAPPGPPPGSQQTPARDPDFQESDFVPEDERGEQREAIQQFEMSKGRESQADRDIAQLQQEFPSVDGSLIAAIYGDSGMGAARETLTELASAT